MADVDKVIDSAISVAKVGLTPSVVGAIGAGFELANNIIGMIEDPARRAKARRMYIDSLNELREKVRDEKDYSKIDEFLLNLTALCHDK